MTIYIICSIRDQAMQTFHRPFASPTKGFAIRQFSDEVNNTNSPMKAHPNDYELFQIGGFDDSNGEIIGLKSPEPLARAADHYIGDNNASDIPKTREQT